MISNEQEVDDTAEHFRYSPDEVMQFLVTIVNKIFEELDIPETTTYGTVTPVLKTNKDKIYPENYRGITVTNTFSTVIEGILKERIEPKLLLSQNKDLTKLQSTPVVSLHKKSDKMLPVLKLIFRHDQQFL